MGIDVDVQWDHLHRQLQGSLLLEADGNLDSTIDATATATTPVNHLNPIGSYLNPVGPDTQGNNGCSGSSGSGIRNGITTCCMLRT